MTPEQTLLIAAGWKPVGDGTWLSPLTGRAFTVEAATRMQGLKARRPRMFKRCHTPPG